MRVCLSDFLGNDNEKIMMTMLETSRNQFTVPVLLKFWYHEGSISEKKLSNFVNRYKPILAHYGTKIYTIESLDNNLDNDAWFNVTTDAGFNDKKVSYRFTYIFDDLKSPIWGCVNSFIGLVNFHTKDKPEKKPFKKRTFDEGRNRR